MSIDQAMMRTSLLPNLIAAVARNQSYGRADVALFEVGSVFLRRGEAVSERPLHELADEPIWAAGVLMNGIFSLHQKSMSGAARYRHITTTWRMVWIPARDAREPRGGRTAAAASSAMCW